MSLAEQASPSPSSELAGLSGSVRRQAPPRRRRRRAPRPNMPPRAAAPAAAAVRSALPPQPNFARLPARPAGRAPTAPGRVAAALARRRRLRGQRLDEWLNRLAAGVLLLSLPALACVLAGP